MTSADDLISALRREGLRITKARRAICAVLADSHDEHLSAVDIRNRASATSGTTIDQSTVYRTVDVLEHLGFLHHVHLGHGPGVFHLSSESGHHHLVCESCGKAIDLPLRELEPLFADVTAKHGFVPDGIHFALAGRCRECTLSG